MSQFNLPASATASKFGWPAPSRADEFAKLLKAPQLPTHRLTFQGKAQDLPIVRLPINVPKYRLANGRTASSQEEYLAKHSSARRDLFSGDPEMLDAQEIQHELLVALGRRSDLVDYFKDTTNKQVEPLLLDEHGFVVNGNRR